MRGRAFPCLLRILGLLTACLLLALPGTAQAGQRLCTSATIEEPFVLPDGSEHAAGSLKLCHLQKHYPTSELLVSYVDGKNVGLLLGVSGHNESSPDADPFLMFARGRDGRLRLYGYGLNKASGMATFTLHRPDRRRASLQQLAPLPSRS
jgi:hypothetical protein